MDTPSALKKLDLTEGASHTAIQTAKDAKLATLKDKQASAPTDALKNKFESMIQHVNEAAEFLQSQSFTESQSTRTEPSMSDDNTETNNSASSGSARSALSQTKLADLPGMAMADSQQVELQPGTVLLGRYEVKELVGQGGMGAVYRVYDQIRSEDIAIKLLLPSLTKNERALERFLNEAKISSKLSHSNIVNVYDVQKDTVAGQADLYFLTMELLEGQDLRQIMDNQTTVGRPFEIDDIKEYVQAITDGLNHAHKFTVHRDIKPENIWITDEGEVKLMDFGIAQLQSTSQRTQTGAAMGTAYYMAPEQLKGKSDIDGRADQYAVAVLMYELLAGEVPAGAIEPIAELRSDTPPAMADAIMKALSPRPEKRFENMDEFNQTIQNSSSSTKKSKSKKTNATTTISNSKLPLIAFVMFALIGLGALGYNGQLDFLKPVDKALQAQKQAHMAKLQGEINNYQKRLSNGQHNLKSDVKDAQRNSSPQLKYLAHWQRFTSDYLFDSEVLIGLEGELSKGENLAKQNTETAITQATHTLTEVRDGYKNLWAQFNSAEDLLKSEEKNSQAKNKWQQRKKTYSLNNPLQVSEAIGFEESAKQSQHEGDFVNALQQWHSATQAWESAYSNAADDVAAIDKQWADNAKAAKDAKAAKAAKDAKDAKIKRLTGKLIKIPAGSFNMGSDSGDSAEKPVHRVSLKAFSMMEAEVTFAQWDACVKAGGCSYKPTDEGWGRGNRPVINVSYNDITQQFIPWLNKATGAKGNNKFRLPSEAQWEYAARAGSTTKYSWGNSINCSQARYGYYSNECGKQKSTDPVKSFSANQWGLYDMHGNVWEWTQDCGNDSYNGAPTNGTAWQNGNCAKRVLRGGSWGIEPNYLRSANRVWNSASNRYFSNGFRLVQGR